MTQNADQDVCLEQVARRAPVDTPLPIHQKLDLRAAEKKVFDAYGSLQRTTEQYKSLKVELAQREKADRIENQTFTDSMMNQAEAYVAERIGAFDPGIRGLQARLDQILARNGAKDGDDLPPGPVAVEYSRIAVTLAQARLDQARVNFEARTYALSHLDQFQKTSAQRAYLERAKALKTVRDRVYTTELAILQGNTAVQSAMKSYREAAQAKLNYMDFVYFSIGGATTATFGDISPNHTSVRMLFSAQILLSIFLVSGWLKDAEILSGAQDQSPSRTPAHLKRHKFRPPSRRRPSPSRQP